MITLSTKSFHDQMTISKQTKLFLFECLCLLLLGCCVCHAQSITYGTTGNEDFKRDRNEFMKILVVGKDTAKAITVMSDFHKKYKKGKRKIYRAWLEVERDIWEEVGSRTFANAINDMALNIAIKEKDASNIFRLSKIGYFINYDMGYYDNLHAYATNMLLAINRKDAYKSHWQTEEACQLLCHAFMTLGYNKKALQAALEWKKAAELRNEDIAKDSSNIAFIDNILKPMEQIATCYVNLGYYDDAKRTVEQIDSLTKAYTGTKYYLFTKKNYGWHSKFACYLHEGKLEEAYSVLDATDVNEIDISNIFNSNIFDKYLAAQKLYDEAEMDLTYGLPKLAKSNIMQIARGFAGQSSHPIYLRSMLSLAKQLYEQNDSSCHEMLSQLLVNCANGKVAMSKEFADITEMLSKSIFKFNKDPEYLPICAALATNRKLSLLAKELLNSDEADVFRIWNKPEYKCWFEETLPMLAESVCHPGLGVYAYLGVNLSKYLKTDIAQMVRERIANSKDEKLMATYRELDKARKHLRHIDLTQDGAYRDKENTENRISLINNQLAEEWNLYDSKIIQDGLADKMYKNLKKYNGKSLYFDFYKYPIKGDMQYGVFFTGGFEDSEGETAAIPIKLFTEKQLDSIQSSTMYSDTLLFHTVWDNVAGIFLEEQFDNIYFSPTGILNKIGIEYALMPNGKRLNEAFNVCRVTATSCSAPSSSIPHRRKPLMAIFGNPVLRNDKYFAGFSDSLPESKVEIDNIYRSIRKSNRCKKFDGNDASEQNFKSLNFSDVNVLHLATHSYYWNKKKGVKFGNASFINNGIYNSEKQGGLNEEDEMLSRCGILLTPGKGEDGVLTAAEISQMYFKNLDLVVLSACNTALGDISDEGTVGLQYAFKKAGAKSILMSLWDIDDAATQIFMTQFYKELFGGKTKSQALKKAQEYLRHYQGGIYDSPYYWASFVLLDP